MPSTILLRDSQSDTGKVPFSTRYKSPDIITYNQVNNPTEFFSSNYNADPNIVVEPQNNNFIYARVKNIGDEASGEVYVNLYANHLSLYMDPRKWENNRVPTVRGNNYSTISKVNPGQIAATDDYFLFNAQKYNGNCCFVCSAGSEKNPDYSWINTRDKYFNWVANNPNVATRNMVTSYNYTIKQFEDLLNISNNYDDEAAVIFEVSAFNLPNGTTYGIKCDTLNINKSVKYDSNTPSSQKFLDNAYLPANYDNYISLYGELPSGVTKWPNEAYITVAARVAFTSSIANDTSSFVHKILTYKYDTEIFSKKLIKPLTEKPTANFSSGIVLGVSLGECGHIYKE